MKPPALLAAQREHTGGAIEANDLREQEDAAVLEAIRLQESAGLDVITDGEMRRTSWAEAFQYLGGLEHRETPRSYPMNARAAGASTIFPTVVQKISPRGPKQIGTEYSFLHEHAASRTKYTMPAPSYFRRFWSDEISTAAYDSCEEFLIDVRDWMRVAVEQLVEVGCDYVQLDAPNYGSLCDPETRDFHRRAGHDLDAEVAHDARLDSSLLSGLGITRAIHICRGNGPAGEWHSTGGYERIAEELFPNLDTDVVLLEYDSERAGDFGPLHEMAADTTAVLGLLTTKAPDLEAGDAIRRRVEEASTVKAVETLALSTQCGFASAANAPMSFEEQTAKLELVGRMARQIWG